MTPESDIPADGTLTFSLGSDWYICPGSVCSVTSGATGTCSDTTVTLTSAYTGGTAIGLSLTKLLVPIVSSASDKNYLASATSSYSGTIDTLSATPTVSMVVPTSTAVGKTGTNTNDVTIKLFPPNISTDNVDFYMRFNLNKKVPANAVITISHSGSSLFTARTSANDYVFFSRGYSSVVISSGSIKITLDADLESGTFVELYVEDAFSSGSTNPTGGIRVKSEYSCGGSAAVVITDDSDSSNTASLNANLAFTYNSTAAATMTGATNLLSASVLNAGEVS